MITVNSFKSSINHQLGKNLDYIFLSVTLFANYATEQRQQRLTTSFLYQLIIHYD